MPLRRNTQVYGNAHANNLQDFKDTVSTLRKLMIDLQNSPYAPELWTNCGRVLAKLGYPELAAGEGYKAILLIQEGQ